MQVVAIVQARMGSTRLPGKTLAEIEAKPMLWHVINRLKYCRLLNRIVVATTTSPGDSAIVEFCQKNDVDYFRGSESNVLDRYYQCAEAFNADAVVRITSDCPLIDPGVVDKVIAAFIKNMGQFEGASNTVNRTYPRGLDTEVVLFSALQRSNREATEKYQQEHVTVYIYEHPEIFRIYSVEHAEDLSALRWTVDEAADLRFVREIYKRLNNADKSFNIDDILGVLANEPGLKIINKDTCQKAIK